MSDGHQLNRRAFMATVAGGVLLGGIWGGAFPVVATDSRPSISVVGHRGAQLVLVDSGEGRALVILGAPDDSLLGRIPAMMTLFRQRIDLIIGDRPTLEQHALGLRSRWSLSHAVIFQSEFKAPALAMKTTTVTSPVTIDLGNGMSLRGNVGHRGAWRAGANTDDPSTLWALKVMHAAGDVLLTPTPASTEALSVDSASLLITPELSPAGLTSGLPARAIAVNVDAEIEQDPSEEAALLTRVYPRDIARFTFGDRGIELPPWAGSGREAEEIPADTPQRP